ncbi:TPA: replication endonuclease [Vibrio vulnificus]
MKEYLDYLESLNTTDTSIYDLREERRLAEQERFKKVRYYHNAFDVEGSIDSQFINNLYFDKNADASIVKKAIGDFSVFLKTEPKEILKVEDIKILAVRFALYVKSSGVAFDTSFNFFGLTFGSFMPKDKNHPNKEAVAFSKCQDAKLITDRLFKIYKQQLELTQIKQGVVSEYMSDKLFNIMLKAKEHSNAYLDSQYIELESGEQLSLLDLQNKTKMNKINEMMMIKNYINELTSTGEYAARFFTITDRPENLPRGYDQNDKTHWDGVSTPKDNADNLQRGWRNIQSRANRAGIELYGIWCREPHKKGGIHQHLLIITKKDFLVNDSIVKAMTNNQTKSKMGLYNKAKKEILESTEMTLEKLFLETFGYTNRSCKIDVLTSKNGSNVVNYITKYIMKTVNVSSYKNTTLDNDQSHLDKVSFHRSLWGYRAYGIFGFKNNLTLWRFLRKVANQQDVLTTRIEQGSKLEQAIRMVKDNDYSSFVPFATEHFQKCFGYSSIENEHGELTKIVSTITDGNNTYSFNLKAIMKDVYNDGLAEIDEYHLDFTKYEIKLK